MWGRTFEWREDLGLGDREGRGMKRGWMSIVNVRQSEASKLLGDDFTDDGGRERYQIEDRLVE